MLQLDRGSQEAEILYRWCTWCRVTCHRQYSISKT